MKEEHERHPMNQNILINHGMFTLSVCNNMLIKKTIIRGYHTAVFISTRISRSSVDYQPEAIAEG